MRRLANRAWTESRRLVQQRRDRHGGQGRHGNHDLRAQHLQVLRILPPAAGPARHRSSAPRNLWALTSPAVTRRGRSCRRRERTIATSGATLPARCRAPPEPAREQVPAAAGSADPGEPDAACRARSAAAGSARAVSVVAPTGYGKTTLMAQWHGTLSSVQPAARRRRLAQPRRERQRPAAIAALPVRRARPLRAGPRLQRGAGDLPHHESLRDPRGPELRLAAHGRPVVLFLDDLHVISDGEAARTLEWLLRYAGTHLRFVVGSRQALGWFPGGVAPAWPADRSGPARPRFNDEEAHRFCASRLAHALEPAALERLLEKTEGGPPPWNCSPWRSTTHPTPAG